MKVPIGREDIADLFKNCLEQKKLAQTYIINGDRGMGKKTVMGYILSLSMCEGGKSCGICPSCKSLEAKAHSDLVEIKRQDGKASIGVDSVRSMMAEVYIRPAIAPYKVVVINEANLLTPEAQNAMLKVIEEPPERVVFFFLCDSLAPILQTVLSRAVTVNLRPLSPDELRKAYAKDVSKFYVHYSLGNIGRLKSIATDENFLNLRDGVTDTFVKMFKGDEFSVFDAVKFFEKNKDNRDEVFDMLLLFSRDAFYKKTGMDNLVINTDKINEINAFSECFSAKGILKVMEIIQNTQIQKGKNGNYTMALTTMLFKCREEINGRSNRNSF